MKMFKWKVNHSLFEFIHWMHVWFYGKKRMILNFYLFLSEKHLKFYDTRILHLKKSTDIKYVLISVPGTYTYLNLCSYTYISLSKNAVSHTHTDQ
jgi:hypothetical protein